MVKLKALKPFRYGGQRMGSGDVFTASIRDAKILRAIGKAAEYREPVAQVVEQAEVPADLSESADPEQGELDSPELVDERPAKRRYKRRDMTAED